MADCGCTEGEGREGDCATSAEGCLICAAAFLDCATQMRCQRLLTPTSCAPSLSYSLSLFLSHSFAVPVHAKFNCSSQNCAVITLNLEIFSLELHMPAETGSQLAIELGKGLVSMGKCRDRDGRRDLLGFKRFFQLFI